MRIPAASVRGYFIHVRKRHWKTEVVVASLEMLSGRSKKEYAKEAQAAAEGDEDTPTLISSSNGASDEPLEAVVAM